MDLEYFCDNYCPIPTRYISTDKPEDNYVECDLDESTCPFGKVDFARVTEYSLGGPAASRDAEQLKVSQGAILAAKKQGYDEGFHSRDAEIEAAREEGYKLGYHEGFIEGLKCPRENGLEG